MRGLYKEKHSFCRTVWLVSIMYGGCRSGNAKKIRKSKEKEILRKSDH